MMRATLAGHDGGIEALARVLHRGPRRHQIAPVIARYLQRKDVDPFDAARVERDAVAIAGAHQRGTAGRAELVPAIGVAPQIVGEGAFLRDEADRFHRHFPMQEAGARAGRAIAFVETGEFGIHVQLDRAAMAGETIGARHGRHSRLFDRDTIDRARVNPRCSDG
jgi:hypothetical protein